MNRYNEAKFSDMEPRNLRRRGVPIYKDLSVSKDLRSIMSKKRAYNAAKKGPMEGKDYSKYVRAAFTHYLNFHQIYDNEGNTLYDALHYYSVVSRSMRSILNVSDSEEENFVPKKDLRSEENTWISNNSLEYSNLDKITLAELAAIWALSRYNVIEENDEATNEAKIAVCEEAAKAVAQKYHFDDQAEDTLDEVTDIIGRFCKKCGYERTSVPEEIGEADAKIDAPFNYALGKSDERAKATYDTALRFTPDEIAQDEAARKRARMVRDSRRKI